MLETVVKMEPEVARKHYLAYRRLLDTQRTSADAEIQQSYLALSRGHSLINAARAVEVSGLGIDKRPRLAFCPADAQTCEVDIGFKRVTFHVRYESYHRTTRRLEVPCHGADPATRNGRTRVPMIPPAHRPPGGALHRYWLMWDVGEKGWEDVPSDPALLRRLNATTFVVLAVWDLTEVEQMVLRGRDV